MKLLSSFILVSSLAFASPQDYGFVYNLQNSIKGNASVLVDVDINSFTGKVAEAVLPPFVAHTNNQALHLTAEQTQKINDSAAAIQLFGPRISLIEASTSHWQTAYSWGDHALAGYAQANNGTVNNLSMTGLTTLNGVARDSWPKAAEIVVDQSGAGDFTSITQALNYVETLRTVNPTKYYHIRVSPGDYYENPHFKGYAIYEGVARRTRIYGQTKISSPGPSFIEGFDFRANPLGVAPVIVNGLNNTCIMGNCYFNHYGTFAGTSIGIIVTNSSSFVHLKHSELYVQNHHVNATNILFRLSGGGVEVFNCRLKTSSSITGLDNEFLAYIDGNGWAQFENSEYMALHDTNALVHISGATTGYVSFMDFSVANNDFPSNTINFVGTSTDKVNWYGKQVGSLHVKGQMSFAGQTVSNFEGMSPYIDHTKIKNLNADLQHQHITLEEKAAYNDLLDLNIYATPVGGGKHELWVKE